MKRRAEINRSLVCFNFHDNLTLVPQLFFNTCPELLTQLSELSLQPRVVPITLFEQIRLKQLDSAWKHLERLYLRLLASALILHRDSPQSRNIVPILAVDSIVIHEIATSVHD